MAAKSEALNCNSILQLYKQNMMLKSMEIKYNEPELTQKQTFKHLGFSDSTIKRYRDDNNMDSFCGRNKYKKKNIKSKTSITQIQTHTANENTKDIKINKNNKKNHLKGGSTSKKDHQDQSTKFHTIARKMIDNV